MKVTVKAVRKIPVKAKKRELPPPRVMEIETEHIRLDALLKLADAVQSGGHAKIVIQDGEVKVNGEICEMRGKKMRDGDIIEFEGRRYEVRSKCE